MWKGAHGVALAIPEGLKAESKLVSMGPVAGEWPGASGPLGSRRERWGALSDERDPLGSEQALGFGWLPGDEGLRRAKSFRRWLTYDYWHVIYFCLMRSVTEIHPSIIYVDSLTDSASAWSITIIIVRFVCTCYGR